MSKTAKEPVKLQHGAVILTLTCPIELAREVDRLATEAEQTRAAFVRSALVAACVSRGAPPSLAKKSFKSRTRPIPVAAE